MLQGNEQEEKNKNNKGKEQTQQEYQDKTPDKNVDIDTQEYEHIIMNHLNNQQGEDGSTGGGEQNQKDIQTQQYEQSSQH
eukprot:15878480-Heterocapsa_arctica.AAC.1